MKPFFPLLILTIFVALPVRAAEFRAPLMQTAPTLDGRIDAGEWAGATRIDGFAWQGSLERRRVSGYVGATATHLFLAVRSQLPDEGALLAEVTRDSENLVFDDSIEVWIDPDGAGATGRRFQLLANSLGHRFWKQHSYGSVPDNPGWRGAWNIANSLHDGSWDCEISVPVEQIAPGRRTTDGAWAINLTRNWKQEWAWSSLGGTEYAPSDRFVFTTEAAPVVSYEQRGDPFGGDFSNVLVLRNPSTVPISVQASLALTRDVMPELKSSQAINLAPGERKEVALPVRDAATKRFKLAAQVASTDGQTTYFSRTLSWTASGAASGAARWVTRQKEIAPVDFQFAYYPYLNRMRLLADVANLPKDAVLQDLTAIVRHKGGAAVKTLKLDTMQGGKQQIEFALPPLSGQYEIALQAKGRNVPVAPVVKTFERKVFAWENFKGGKSSKVYAPFTPIRVTGKHVATVLREHAMNDGGLWDQVVAKGAPLLAAPMRWAAKIEGANVPIKAQALKFSRVAPNTALARSRWSAAAWRGEVASTWDYDGTMRVDLTLAPSGGRRVDALTLEIPLKDAAATHLHAMGDGLRNTLYQKVPAGEGVVWTSKQVQASDLPANFCTYLYLGTPARGLSWFAENDKDWNWNPQTPNLELVRDKDRLILRVHLINVPLVIDAPRTITFGLLAAPVKPRWAPDWRHKWRRDNYHLLGTDINWLALGDAASLYPAGRDMFLWEMLARGNKETLSEADVNRVIERGKPYFEPYGAEAVNSFVAHANLNLRAHRGANMVFYYNRASYAAAEEFETFKDEWSTSDWRTLEKSNSRGEIKIVPTASYIDHALYWYGKSFDIGGNKGVYWDNWFFNGSYNTAMTGAYQRADGTLAPSTGVWGLRELAKRTFQYMNERGLAPLTMPHITSTAILPMLSFATIQYDWEWKYSEGDVQNRFSREYILMVSNGDLAGTWPVLLGDHGKLEDDLWTGRTFAAVAMLHELDVNYSGWTKTGQMQRALFKPIDDILAQPGVQVFRYWDERAQPVVTGNPDLPAIVYAVKGKRAVFAVVSYAQSDQTARVAIDAVALGFNRGFKVVDAENGQAVAVENNSLSFPLKKHDLRIFEVQAP